jgi:hypothetical protein
MNHHLRISNGHSHAEEFEAATLPQFRARFLEALDRFTQWRMDCYPPHQTRKREWEAKYDPLLQLHFRDPWMLATRGSVDWVMCHHLGMFPVVTRRAFFHDGGETMWRHVEFTARHVEEFAKFFGYHPNGEDRLGDFLKEALPDPPQPKLHIVKEEP